MNQCATLERLIDALTWAEAWHELAGAHVVRCNPTTSSAPLEQGRKTEADHDLVLVDREGARWSFEVSDVASERDGNGKEKKDLVSLGIPMAEGEGWPPGRSFLVVSTEFAERLRKPSRHGLGRGVFHYVEHTHGTTTLFEVCPGRG